MNWSCNCTGPQSGARVCPCRELAERNETQDETITRYQRENDRLTKRVETQQGMIDWLQAWKAKAEEAQTPQAQAERVFTNGK